MRSINPLPHPVYPSLHYPDQLFCRIYVLCSSKPHVAYVQSWRFVFFILSRNLLLKWVNAICSFARATYSFQNHIIEHFTKGVWAPIRQTNFCRSWLYIISVIEKWFYLLWIIWEQRLLHLNIFYQFCVPISSSLFRVFPHWISSSWEYLPKALVLLMFISSAFLSMPFLSLLITCDTILLCFVMHYS